ncbi:MAG: germination protein YpeB [Clostridia bacterium]|jgi:spore germination protein|nr:germination protein YpeB [Clostridia bacterium]
MEVKKLLLRIFAVALAVSLIVITYSQVSNNQRLSLQVENNYQLAFIDLTTHLEHVEEDLVMTMASASQENMAIMMASIWRNVYAAQKSIGQLPFVLAPLEETEKLLFNVAGFAEDTLVSLVNNDGIDMNYDILQNITHQVKDVNTSLQKLTHEILTENKSWLQLQQQLINTAGMPLNNSIANGLQEMDGKVSQYPELSIFGQKQSIVSKPDWYEYSRDISPQEAMEKMQRLISSEIDDVFINNGEVVATRGDLPGYMVTLFSNKGNITGQITKRAGRLNWLIWEKPIILTAGNNIDIHKATAKAQTFLLDAHQVTDLKELSRTVTPNYYEFNYVCVDNGITCYPDLFWVRIARDDGKIVGYNGNQFLMNHRQRVFNEVKIAEEHINNFLNPSLTEVQVMGLVLIPSKFNQEILVYEVFGEIGAESYIIFINATTGKEELIIRKK